MTDEESFRTFADGEVSMWIDGGIHLKACSAYGDPAELTSEAAREIAKALLELAQRIDD